MSILPLPALALVPFLVMACAFDLAQRRIPNRLVAAGLLVALLLHGLAGAMSSLMTVYLAGALVGCLMLLPLYLLGGMAAGDVKLMAMAGAFAGPALAVQMGLASYVAGGLLALGIVLAKRQGRAAAHNLANILLPALLRMQGVKLAKESTPPPSVGGMPYAIAITAGVLFVLWLRHT